MRFLKTVIIVITALVIGGCSASVDSGDSTTGGYSNKLTFGTGWNTSNFTLTGEGTTFNLTGGSATLYYRLESANDLAGNAVSIKVEKQTTGGYTTVGTYSYTNPQNYGHIIMSSISITGAGTYRMTGQMGTVSAATTIATTSIVLQ